MNKKAAKITDCGWTAYGLRLQRAKIVVDWFSHGSLCMKLNGRVAETASRFAGVGIVYKQNRQTGFSKSYDCSVLISTRFSLNEGFAGRAVTTL